MQKPSLPPHESVFSQPLTTLDFLEEILDTKIFNLKPFARGQHSRIFSFESLNRRLILRVAHDPSHVFKEWQAQKWLGNYLPIPEVVQEGTQYHEFWAITHKAPGKSLAGQSADYQLQVFELLLRLQRAPLPREFKGFGPFNWQKGLGRASWKAWLADLHSYAQVHNHQDSLLDASLLERIQARLQQLLPFCPEIGWPMHGDFKAANLIAEQGRITGVVDWSNLGCGDFLYDLAVYLLYLPSAERMAMLRHSLKAYAARGYDLSHSQERVYAYILHSATGALLTMGQRHQHAEFEDLRQKIMPLLEIT